MENLIVNSGTSKEEREKLITQWRGSGKTKINFCKEAGINYQTFIGWTNPPKKKKQAGFNRFIPVPLPKRSGHVFAELNFKNGTSLLLHEEVTSQFLRSLLA
jgi:hypothetical protein